jgi:hypothetical protein
MSATGTACAKASGKPAETPCPTTNCWKWFCSGRSPWRDTKPLAKALIARFGSFAEVINAPDDRLQEVDDVGDAVTIG